MGDVTDIQALIDKLWEAHRLSAYGYVRTVDVEKMIRQHFAEQPIDGNYQGAMADLNELVRVAIHNRKGLDGFLRDNYPREWAEQPMGDASTRKDEVHKANASVQTSSPTTTPAQGDVERVKKAIALVFVPDGIYNIEEGWKLERAAKAALAAMQPAPALKPLYVVNCDKCGGTHLADKDCKPEPVVDEHSNIRLIRELGKLIHCHTGGTFENDPPDAILDAAIRYLRTQPVKPVSLDAPERESVVQLPSNMNQMELDTLRRIRELTKHGYKTIDIKVRKDGVETWFEGDFLSGTRVKP